ncbi:MAG: sulfotransferase family protein [Chloroflexi bacterium]|nr:sulfotransferase family protein [Chloroflexota bacterium]
MKSKFNNAYGGKETVVFYHLPKTAGTTLNAILKQNYNHDEIVSHGIDTHAFVAAFAQWSEEQRKGIRLLTGHFPFGIHALLPQPSRCFTILRNPIERTISYYFHAMRDPQHYLHGLIHEGKMPLKALIESGEALMMNDGQTRLLSAVWGDAPAGSITDEILDTAVSNLQTMTVVGLTEQFDATTLLLQLAFGWRNIYHTRKNVGINWQKRDDLDKETLATIINYNQQDMRLYRAAQERMKAQMQKYSPLFAAKIVAFQIKQKTRHFSFQYYLQKLFSQKTLTQHKD